MNNIIEAAKKHERTIGKLYAIYGQKLPSHHAFWNKLSKEEEGHARTIEFFESKVAEGKIEIDETRFSPEVMSFLQDAVDVALKETEENFSHQKALKNALKAEKSLVEKKYFDIFKTSDEELNSTMSKLEKETESHAERIETELEEETQFSKKHHLPK